MNTQNWTLYCAKIWMDMHNKAF